MPLATPLSCDLHVQDGGGAIVQEIRLRYAPAPTGGEHPIVTVEPLLGSGAAIPFTAEEWIADDDKNLAFIERVFMLPRVLWTRDLDPKLEITFDEAKTQVVFEALSAAANPFSRTVVFSAPGGVPTVTVQPFDASDPMALHTFRLFIEAVESLIALNTERSVNRGL